MRKCWVLFGLGLAVTAQAMDMSLTNGVLRASGNVVREDIDRFDGLIATEKPNIVIVGPSKGGDLKAAYRIAAKIRALHAATLVEGDCASACAVIFMGGEKRQFADAADLSRTTLRFHGPHKHESQAVSEQGAPRLYDWLMEMSGQRFDPAILRRAMYIRDKGDMMWFAHPSAQRQGHSVWFCPGGTRRKPQDCEAMEGIDALTQGVLTDAALGRAE